jgi:catechol 2,3-dioxygenase-like lactoylglutathione lyase family enzyme
MIIGLHTLIYSKDAEKDRAFLRDVLGFRAVDAGHGWLIFEMPPAEMGVHPTEGEETHELYLMTDNVETTVSELRAKGVECSEIQNAGFGRMTHITLPGGGKLGIYEPRHALAIKQDH